MTARPPGRAAALARTLGLGVRLAVGGGREQLVRLAVTAVGVGLGATLLLLAAVAYPAIQAQDQRYAWADTTAHNTRSAQDESRTDPLLWLDRVDGFDHRDIERVDLAATGPAAPVPPGLSRLPGPGELAVSPALRDLLARTPADQLADRYPGRIVATIGRPALVGPDSLVVFVGHDPAELRGQPGVAEVRGIESAPQSISLTRFARILVALGAAALLLPILVLIGTATRLSAARREQRLAAMRLVGATVGQLRLVATVEAALGALAGSLLGFVGFVLVRPAAANVTVTGSRFFVADLRLSWGAALLVGLGVPVACALSALLSLRRVRISPLAVQRQAPPGRPSWRRLVPLVIVLAGFLVSLPTLVRAGGSTPLWLTAGLMGALIVGIVVAGPWLTVAVGRLLVRVSRGSTGLLAGYRLAGDPAAAFRSISGLVLAVFLVTVASVSTASGLARASADPATVRIPDGTVGEEFVGRDAVPVPAQAADRAVARLRATPGVTGVLDLRTPTGGARNWSDDVRVVARCADLRATGLATCADPGATVGLDAYELTVGNLGEPTAPVVRTDPDRLPLLAVLVTTTGDRATMERVRTVLAAVVGPSGHLPFTTDELKGRNTAQADTINRLSDAVLLATLLIAGASLTVSVAGGLAERRRPFALLRLAGMRPGELRRMLLAETAAPLIATAALSVALGLVVAADAARAGGMPWRLPEVGYWVALGAGLLVAVALAVAATGPLLSRLTSLETARFE
ncbi:FtsX-like permease family protein [Micromonospora chersina]|uniref:FtsX-like permease family protein n=1 Tax=Micromonospora chersina TaxID=47854 RepID=UPI0036C2CB74